MDHAQVKSKFPLVAKLIYDRLLQLKKDSLILFWHRTTIELFKYLVFKRH